MTRDIGVDAVIDRIRFEEQGSDPSTPAAGFNYLFVKADGLYLLTDAGESIGPFITGTAQVGGDIGTGSVGVLDDGVFKLQAENLDFVGGIEVVFTGTTAYIGTTGTAGGGAGSFDDLSDTPSSKSGQGAKLLRVNEAENALEYIGDGNPGTFAPGGYGSTLHAWWDAAVNIELTGSLGVSGWVDMSGNNRRFFQTNSATWPFYQTGTALNGLPAVAFDGVNDVMQSTGTVPSTGAGLVTVATVLPWAGGGNGTHRHVISYGANSTNQLFSITHRTQATDRFGSHYWGDVYLFGPSSHIAPAIVVAAFDGTDFHMWVNGSPYPADTQPLNIGNGSANLGAHQGPGEWGHFSVSEILMWEGLLTDSELEDMFSKLGYKYRIRNRWWSPY